MTARGTTPSNLIDEEIYTYGNENWGDQLTAYNGSSILYDDIGNPTSYYNGATFGWIGRRLTSASKSGNSYTFVYDSEGIRTEKTVNGVKHIYRYIDGRLYSEEWGNHLIVFLYNATGAPIGMRYRTSSYSANVWDTYWFERNLQGDITAIYNASGTKLVSYKYDAWGNQTVTYSNGGANIVPVANNPLRYRGYYYDADLGLYYLQTRYYDSNTGRFINADCYISTGTGMLGYNMYAYCNNNPVMYVDPSGNNWESIVEDIINFFKSLFGGSSRESSSSNNTNINSAESELSLKDPAAAYQVYESKNIADEYVTQFYGSHKDGTESNAFRHAMWNAVMTDKIGEEKAKQFADAHEANADNPTNHKNMDLHNNALGRRIAIENAGKGYDVFAQKIKEAIDNGEAITWAD